MTITSVIAKNITVKQKATKVAKLFLKSHQNHKEHKKFLCFICFLCFFLKKRKSFYLPITPKIAPITK